MVANRTEALLELTDAAIADVNQLEKLSTALSFWPVFRQDVWNWLLEKAESILTCSDGDCDQSSFMLCLEAVLKLCSPSDRFVGVVADLPQEVFFHLVSMMSSNSRSVLVSALTSNHPNLADEIALRFDTSSFPIETAVSCESESVQLPYNSHWVEPLLRQSKPAIRQSLHYLYQQCHDDVYWKEAVDQLVAGCDRDLLNQLCIWNIAEVRQFVSERRLLRSPSRSILASLGLAENDHIGNGSRLFSRGRRKSSDFLVQPERFAMELESFLRSQDPAANYLELAAAVLGSLVKYPNAQLRKQIFGALLSHVPSRFNLEAFNTVCSESVQSDSNAASVITFVNEMIARRRVRVR